MRILAVNTFLFSMFSFVARIVLLPYAVLQELADMALAFVSPVPFCTAACLTHLRRSFGISTQLRDVYLENVAEVAATAFKLCHAGSLEDSVMEAAAQNLQLASAGQRPVAHFMLCDHGACRKLELALPDLSKIEDY